MLDQSEKKRRERNRLAQQRHRDKARERARQWDSRLRELEQAIEEIMDAVGNDCVDRIRLVLTKMAKGPEDCNHYAAVSKRLFFCASAKHSINIQS